ncbi:pentatricopeptide repeat domain-containing protein 3, mitochondrial isoform X2 [Trichosurus vulpecula]|uniref:pentatricopeptide repeat domain-containing protein 3, mitochondrial isoform X2 n=1 Tax=Trichosurus vulpecula TaxID=9337 RepID=UPI00186AD900|nr:pentatricopeptide repeat domain-containing protein 3, mitochondrial isoform X2 [Trichosurus vulpecula]
MGFYSGSALPEAAGADLPGSEEVVIPKRKTWDNVAVLQALASTIQRDPTAAHYTFQDDPFLIPVTSSEARMFLLAKDSGKKAAKYIINTYPKFFEKDIAEPHIPCLTPEYLDPQLEEVSEAALRERIRLHKVKASVDMFDQLLQAGTCVSLETTNSLLDLLCYYGDQEPPREEQPHQIDESEALEEAEEKPARKGSRQKVAVASQPRITWRANNNAERIFNLMPEKNAHSYCTMIRGMAKYQADEKAFRMYTDLLNSRLQADVHTFNALIEASFSTREKYEDKWNLILDLLRQMAEQKVKPNLQTFNAILRALRKMGSFGRIPALQTLCEMKALKIEPSLSTYHYILEMFYKSAPTVKISSSFFSDIISELQGKKLCVQDLDDGRFFPSAMKVCFMLKDLDLAYQVHNILRTGDNWKLLGDAFQNSFYYHKFFSLLCLMEQMDVTLEWYKELIPSVCFPHSHLLMSLLQALDVGSRLEMIPEIWRDCREFGLTQRNDVREEMLTLMTREKHPPEIQEAFADCAADIKSTYEDEGKMLPEWPTGPMNCIALLLLRGGRTQEAWQILENFKKQNRIPRTELMNEFMSSAKENHNSAQAVQLVKLAHSLSLAICEPLTQRVLTEFDVSKEQKKALEDLSGTTSDSDSDSSSSDSE